MSGATAPEAETIIRQTETINRLMGNSATQIERVQRQLDSAYAAQQRYEQAQNAINSAVERGRISQERANQLLQLAQQRYQQTGVAAQQFAVANDNAARSMGRSGQVITSAGFQLQDFATQVAGGTSALTAFAQQAPQFLGVFGPGGAIAGAVVAVGAVALSLLTMGDNGAAAARRIEDGFRATQRAGEDLTRVVQALSNELLTASERAANLANNQRAALVAEGRSQMMRLENERIAAGEQQSRAQRDLAAADRDEARFRRMGPGFDSELRDVQGRRFSAQAQLDAARSTQDQVTQQINELRRLTDRAEMIRNGSEEMGPPAPEAPARRTGGGGGGGRAAPRNTEADRLDRAAEAARRAVDPTRQYAQEVRDLYALQQAGTITHEEYAARMDAIGEAIARTDQQTRTLVDSSKEWHRAADGAAKALSSAFEDLVFEGASLDDVLKNLERSLLRIGNQTLLQPLFQQGFNALFGTGGGGNLGNTGGGGAGGLIGQATSAIGSWFSASVAHTGGMIDDPSLPRRAVPAEVFLDAPRYHSGGMAGGMRFASDEVPAVLRRGEMVLTERQQAAVANRGSINQTVIVRAEDPGAFNRTRGQMAQAMRRDLARASRSA
jgi:hypothetical protein